MGCECRICRRNKEFENHCKGLTKEQISFFDNIMLELCSSEHDAEWYEALYKGEIK